MWLTNESTGEVTKRHLFVAMLPYSQYSYVEATLDMRQNTWLLCHVRARDFFGGEVTHDLDGFKRRCDLIVANRWDDEFVDVAEKVYTRDLFRWD